MSNTQKEKIKVIDGSTKYNEAEATVIRDMEISDGEWDTSHFPYMTDEQIIDVHRYLYKQLLEDVQMLRGGSSIGDLFVPIMVKTLLIETNKRFKGVKPS